MYTKYCLTQSDSKYFAKIRATETYYIPNYWKFHEHFAELFRFEIAPLCEGEHPILPFPLIIHIPLYQG